MTDADPVREAFREEWLKADRAVTEAMAAAMNVEEEVEVVRSAGQELFTAGYAAGREAGLEEAAERQDRWAREAREIGADEDASSAAWETVAIEHENEAAAIRALAAPPKEEAS